MLLLAHTNAGDNLDEEKRELQQEHSWDCPCHSSRFSENGKLINHPATGDLKHKIDDQNE